MTPSELIKEILKTKNINVTKMAEETGALKAMLYNIKNEKANINKPTAKKISQTYNMPYEDIMALRQNFQRRGTAVDVRGTKEGSIGHLPTNQKELSKYCDDILDGVG